MFPPKAPFVMEYAKSQSAPAGTIVPWTDATVCARPFVAPSNRLLGAAEDMYMDAVPEREIQAPTAHTQELR